MRESRGMPGGPVLAGVVGLLSIIFFALGYIDLGTCSNGLSLIYFGIGVVLIAGALALVGQIYPALLCFVLFLILVLAGLALSHGGACPS